MKVDNDQKKKNPDAYSFTQCLLLKQCINMEKEQLLQQLYLNIIVKVALCTTEDKIMVCEKWKFKITVYFVTSVHINRGAFYLQNIKKSGAVFFIF